MVDNSSGVWINMSNYDYPGKNGLMNVASQYIESSKIRVQKAQIWLKMIPRRGSR